jgi:hypothetical protein
MNWKPWHHSGVAFEQIFWQYANACAFAEDIRAIKQNYTKSDRLRDKRAGEQLVLTAKREIEAAGRMASMPVSPLSCRAAHA